MKEVVEKALSEVLKDLSALQELPPAIKIEVPKDKSHGDLATNVAFLMAKTLKKIPDEVALLLSERLSQNPAFSKVYPLRGFINFRFSRQFLLSELERVLHEGEEYFRANLGKGKRYQLEFVSANPTGPLHLGHGRGAVVGDALSRIMSFLGYNITREYYINDAGRQVYLLGLSIAYRYYELLGRRDLMKPIEKEFEEEGYKGDYIKDLARLLASVVGDAIAEGKVAHAHSLLMDASLPCDPLYMPTFDPAKEDAIELASLFGLDCIMREIKKDLATLGVSFDSWVSERELRRKGKVREVIERLSEKGYTYESEGALWLRTSELGDDKDRVLMKSGGELTYFASDIAYHLDKFRRGFEKVIDFWGADHHGYIKRVKSALKIFGIEEDWLEVYLIQMVKLFRDGKEVKMSKRSGKFISLRELIEEVGADAVRFVFLTRRGDTPLDFDVDLVKEKSSENPVFYVQYAHARIAGVFREFKKRFGEEPKDSRIEERLNNLSLEEEMELIKKVLFLKDVLIDLHRSRDPHQITFYLIDLAKAFHHYYNHHRVIGGDKEIMLARLSLLKAVRTALGLGLKLIGVSAPERM